MSDPSKILDDVNTREYWLAAVNDPTRYGLNAHAVNLIKISLDLNDPGYWSKVLVAPEAHGFSSAQAIQLARHFSRNRSDIDYGPSVGWFDATLEADHWDALHAIKPIEAAMLLCRFNPNAESYDDAMLTTTDELGPEHLQRLAQRLADIDKSELKPRTLRDWHQTARDLGLIYHSWIDEYIEATGPPTSLEVAPATIATAQKKANEWESDAQSRALEIIKEQKAKDLYPNQIDIADQIASEFRANGRVGSDGKPISGAYIKRHALKGITSAVGKRLSTTKR